MVDVGLCAGRLRFIAKKALRGPPGERRRHDLDGDVTLQSGIVRAISLAHAPGAEGGHDLVGADAESGIERQGTRGL